MNESQERRKKGQRKDRKWLRRKRGISIVASIPVNFVVSVFSKLFSIPTFRDREERISALNAAKQAEKEELQKKIRTKQAETARRHEENMESIRQKAAELGAPRVQEENGPPSSYRVCTLCSVIVCRTLKQKNVKI